MKQSNRNEKGQIKKEENLVGRIYGKLVVIEEILPLGKPRRVRCRCECGNVTTPILAHLKNGTCKSCGCGMRESARRPKGTCGFNVVWGNARWGATSRGFCWELTKEQLKDLHEKPCVYCGAIRRSYLAIGDSEEAKEWSGYSYNGVDRVDSDKGYTLDNVVTCCIDCNRAKNAMSVEEFRAWVLRVHSHWASK